ncbi:flagellar basal-body rod modification protein FlgD [Oikeobacillus pervagus]|uniref:Basal-body rod modification protein FlgD n=1 Tax=Oikeobacillus pervagus TaxID=1325931 RepID=A0AAJ1SZU0_9BACI|nr:flagellar hook assembly protein FlgD [Oikeobacillus pervagus]MDQ0214297.1 flagellar basal-body rod modification protein FlgD [Oikeobacillus pervagus]
MSSKIDPSLYLANSPTNQRKPGGDILGKDDFLKLLMAQLQNQDPMNPMQDKDFIAQMATFSSLEQMTNLATSFDKFVQLEQQSQLVTYNSFVGKEVTWHKLETSEDSNEEPKVIEGKGIVKSVKFKENTVQFILEDGTVLQPANISQVNHQPSGNALVDASHLIGQKVSWMKEEKEISDIVQSVSMKDGVIWLLMKTGEKINADHLIKIEKSE